MRFGVSPNVFGEITETFVPPLAIVFRQHLRGRFFLVGRVSSATDTHLVQPCLGLCLPGQMTGVYAAFVSTHARVTGLMPIQRRSTMCQQTHEPKALVCTNGTADYYAFYGVFASAGGEAT